MFEENYTETLKKCITLLSRILRVKVKLFSSENCVCCNVYHVPMQVAISKYADVLLSDVFLKFFSTHWEGSNFRM